MCTCTMMICFFDQLPAISIQELKHLILYFRNQGYWCHSYFLSCRFERKREGCSLSFQIGGDNIHCSLTQFPLTCHLNVPALKPSSGRKKVKLCTFTLTTCIYSPANCAQFIPGNCQICLHSKTLLWWDVDSDSGTKEESLSFLGGEGFYFRLELNLCTILTELGP